MGCQGAGVGEKLAEICKSTDRGVIFDGVIIIEMKAIVEVIRIDYYDEKQGYKG